MTEDNKHCDSPHDCITTCCFKVLNWLCFIQTDPTKVESVQDVLARAAAKGLLGAIISEPSKTGKKKKSRKNRAASATSKPPSASCQFGEDGGESVNGPDSEETSEYEDEEDERELTAGEESGAERKDDKVKDEKKQRRRKRNPKQSKKAATDTKSHKKRKKKGNQSQMKKKQVSNKPRRIPRLTLTLISSANPSHRLTPITALAHKISGTPVVKHQQAGPRPPPLSGKQSSPAQPASNETQNSPHEGAARTVKNGAEAPTQVRRPESEAGTQEVMKPADFILPPISSPSFNNSSACQLPS